MIYTNDNDNKKVVDPPVILSTPTISRERIKTHISNNNNNNSNVYDNHQKKGLDKLVLTPHKEGAVKIANSSNTYQLGNYIYYN